MGDVKTRIENDFGQDNIYKLIYAGKILKDDNTLKSYNIKEKQFIVLMITKPNIIKKEEEVNDTEYGDPPEATKKPLELEENIDPEPISICEEKSKSVKDLIELDDDVGGKDDASDCSESIPSLSFDIENVVTEEASAVYNVYDDSEDSDDEGVKVGLEWIEQEIKKKSESHFITNKDFSIALDVVWI